MYSIAIAELSRGFDPDNDEDRTPYVVSRWYRAPEIMLGTRVI